MSELGPLAMEPLIVPKPWGGRRLEAFGKTLPTDASYGESWEIADLPSDRVSSAPSSRTLVSRGPRAGMSLRSLIAELGTDLIGSARPTAAGDFPLLVKMLDASEHLSVQLHPDEGYVAQHPGCWHKTESWYVVAADPDAHLMLGFREGVTDADVAAAAGSAALEGLMRKVPAVPGEFHHLPAGLVHALGAGVMVIEPQTPSDTTFRLYDWTAEYTREARKLHISEGLEALTIDPSHCVSLPPMVEGGNRTLVTTPHYWMREHKASGAMIQLREGSELRVLSLVDGEAIVSHSAGAPMSMLPGSTLLIPARIAEQVQVEAVSSSTLLEIGLV